MRCKYCDYFMDEDERECYRCKKEVLFVCRCHGEGIRFVKGSSLGSRDATCSVTHKHVPPVHVRELTPSKVPELFIAQIGRKDKMTNYNQLCDMCRRKIIRSSDTISADYLIFCNEVCADFWLKAEIAKETEVEETEK